MNSFKCELINLDLFGIFNFQNVTSTCLLSQLIKVIHVALSFCSLNSVRFHHAGPYALLLENSGKTNDDRSTISESIVRRSERITRRTDVSASNQLGGSSAAVPKSSAYALDFIHASAVTAQFDAGFPGKFDIEPVRSNFDRKFAHADQ
jgi:hypothetical protein